MPWHSERGLRTLFDVWNPRHYLLVLPRQRLFRSNLDDATMEIDILSLNGAPGSRVFP
jgi:hypothetical protein